MKKILTCILTVILTLTCITACSNGANRFYNSKVLKKFQITDFPKPQGAEDFEATNSRLSFNTTAEGFEDYAEQLYTYLVGKDFKYFGYRGDVISTFFGGAPEYEFYISSEFSEHQCLVDSNGKEYENRYIFVFSNELSESNGLLNECAIELIYRPDDEEYNTHLCIYYDKNVFTGYTLITENTPEHEHTITYVSAGVAGHFENYTCGCPQDFGAVPHYDENMDCICDACGYDMNEDYPPLVDETVSLTQFASWLTELNAENVAEIKTTFEYVGVAPGRLKDISRTTDKTMIAYMLDKYANTEMRPVAREETYVDGGSAFTIEFKLTDGTVKQLYFNNGFYAYGLYEDEISALCYFELCSIPTLKDYDNVTKSNGFITYLGTGMVYDKDGNPVCEIPTTELEFIIMDYDYTLLANGYDYCVDTEFGKLHFVKADIFATDELNSVLVGTNYYFIVEGDTEFCYRLVGKNLDQLIAEYSTTTE